jgi:hypothetical protein
MTKPYHLTQEQAFCLIQRLEGLGFNISTQDDPVAMAAFANAVLDEVLGEPVAWRYSTAQERYRYRGYVPNFDKEYETLKPIALYAPKELK